MKTNKKNGFINIVFFLSFILFLASCQKETSVANTPVSPAAIAATQAVSVGVSTSTNDSIYVVGTCPENHHLDSVAFSSLPANLTAYLTSNYAGYTFQKAYDVKDSLGNITGYVAIIQYNGNPVGLKFDASGNFVGVLEQREGHDLTGEGWHEGGRYGCRDGKHKDSVNLASLPAPILSYFNTNYPQDTLIRAYKNIDSSYIVFSKDNGAFVSVFDSTGTFVKRVQLYDHTGGEVVNLNSSSLPAAIQSYLLTTYPNYVFDQAFSFSENGVLLGYVVGIDANGTKYGIQFDASGNFVKAVTIR